MNTSTRTGFHSASRVTRLLAWLSRGETPVDGFTYLEPRASLNDESRRSEMARCVHEAEEAGLMPRAPVRWGNYR
jgi:hypothetical protein